MKFNNFLEMLDLDEKVTYEEFLQKFNKRKSDRPNSPVVNCYDWIKALPEDDYRKQKTNSLWGDDEYLYDEIMKGYYKFFVADRENVLQMWFNQHCSAKPISNYINMNFNKNLILSGDILNASHKDNTGRIIKNTYCDYIYDVKSSSSGLYKETMFNFLTTFKDLKLIRDGLGPMYCKKILKYDIKNYFACLRGCLSKASIFNPYFAGWTLHKLLKSKKIFTPCLGWSSYAMGAINCPSVTQYVGTDVIPDVCDRTKQLFKDCNSKIETDIYCCPSEKLDERHNFSNKYKENFDTIFFSPPYFSLEQYNGGEQSHESFPKYEDWLSGYWEETVKLCDRVLQKGGNFTFIISNYRDMIEKREYKIAEDMRDIASKYFTLEKDYKVAWKTQKGLSCDKMKEGNFEHFYIFRKK